MIFNKNKLVLIRWIKKWIKNGLKMVPVIPLLLRRCLTRRTLGLEAANTTPDTVPAICLSNLHVDL